MKYLFLFFLSLVSSASWAQEPSRRELVKLALERLSPEEEQVKVTPNFMIAQGWSNLFDRQNLDRDNYKHRLQWRDLFPIIEDRVHHIRGSRVFYGLIKKHYRYDIHQSSRTNNLTVNLKDSKPKAAGGGSKSRKEEQAKQLADKMVGETVNST